VVHPIFQIFAVCCRFNTQGKADDPHGVALCERHEPSIAITTVLIDLLKTSFRQLHRYLRRESVSEAASMT
jgi:hypothetical protein